MTIEKSWRREKGTENKRFTAAPESGCMYGGKREREKECVFNEHKDTQKANELIFYYYFIAHCGNTWILSTLLFSVAETDQTSNFCCSTNKMRCRQRSSLPFTRKCSFIVCEVENWKNQKLIHCIHHHHFVALSVPSSAMRQKTFNQNIYELYDCLMVDLMCAR